MAEIGDREFKFMQFMKAKNGISGNQSMNPIIKWSGIIVLTLTITFAAGKANQMINNHETRITCIETKLDKLDIVIGNQKDIKQLLIDIIGKK